MSSLRLALLIFGVCYALIMTEQLRKTIVALFGAVL
jgi:Na+/H+ antiporter NhaD/arsenite permease-like protein